MIEQISEKLDKYGYNYERVKNKLFVKINYSQEISITFTEDGKYIIKDRFINWNFLTGFLSFSLKDSMVYNSIILFVTFILFFYLDKISSTTNYLFIFVFCISFIILWTTYFLIKSENFKKQIIDWIEK